MIHQTHPADKQYSHGLKINFSHASPLSLALGHFVYIEKKGVLTQLLSEQVKTGDKMVYLPQGSTQHTLTTVTSIEQLSLKSEEFIEMHTQSYTVIVGQVLAHCSSIHDSVYLRPLEQIFCRLMPKTINRIYAYHKL